MITKINNWLNCSDEQTSENRKATVAAVTAIIASTLFFSNIDTICRALVSMSGAAL